MATHPDPAVLLAAVLLTTGPVKVEEHKIAEIEQGGLPHIYLNAIANSDLIDVVARYDEPDYDHAGDKYNLNEAADFIDAVVAEEAE